LASDVSLLPVKDMISDYCQDVPEKHGRALNLPDFFKRFSVSIKKMECRRYNKS